MTTGIKLELSLGRSFEEYLQMFKLTADDLAKRIIGCGDGFSNFNKRMTELGSNIISCDPLYTQSTDELRHYLMNKKNETILQPTRKPEDSFFIFSLRKTFIEDFFEDYEPGKEQNRYLPYSLPKLPFRDREFDIALCSHFLFTYSDLGLGFHYDSIREMLRIANEVRIFPLIDLNCQKPAFLEPLIEKLKEQHCQVEVINVDYGFYHNENEMLLIQAKNGRFLSD